MNLWASRDPRAKTLFALLVGLALVLVPSGRSWWIAIPTMGLLVTAGVPRRRLVTLLKGVLLLWGLSLLANAYLRGGTRVGPEWLGGLRPVGEGLHDGLGSGARLGGLAALGAWLAETTRALDLTGSLEWGVRRVSRARITVHRTLFPVLLALRLVPLLVEEARRLLEIERLRGGNRGRLASVARVGRLAPLWVTLVVERAEALALALALRGYDPERPRGFARSYRWRAGDWGLVALGAVALLGWRR